MYIFQTCSWGFRYYANDTHNCIFRGIHHSSCDFQDLCLACNVALGIHIPSQMVIGPSAPCSMPCRHMLHTWSVWDRVGQLESDGFQVVGPKALITDILGEGRVGPAKVKVHLGRDTKKTSFWAANPWLVVMEKTIENFRCSPGMFLSMLIGLFERRLRDVCTFVTPDCCLKKR